MRTKKKRLTRMWEDIKDPWSEENKPKAPLTSQEKLDKTLRLKYEKIVNKKVKSLSGLNIKYKEGEQYRIVTEMAINAIVVIEELLTKYQIEEVVIAVYRMNLRSVERIKSIIKETGANCTVLLSSFFRENKRYEKWCEMLIDYADKSNARVGFAWSHAKVFLCKTKCGKHIVFEGSGNLSDNARIEQYILENNKSTYDFHKGWILEYVSAFEDSSDEDN